MKKLFLIAIIVSMTGCSSLVQMNEKHSGQRKELRAEQKQEIKELKITHKKETKKLKTKQSVEFSLYVANKIGLLKKFFQ